MIEQQRELLRPGQGIMRDPGSARQFEEYPKMMTHPGFQAGRPDIEEKILDAHGQPTGQRRYHGGQPNRFSPVLVHSLADEEYHASQGYQNPVKMDAAAFDRAVANHTQVPETYIPIEYPKYVFGKIVNNFDEAQARLVELNINADGTPRSSGAEPDTGKPALSAEVNTLEAWPPLADEARAMLAADVRHQMFTDEVATQALREREEDEDPEILALEEQLAALRTKRRIVALKAEIAAELAELEAAEIAAQPVASQDAGAVAVDKHAENIRKMREGKARKQAEREAAKLQEADKEDTNRLDATLD